MAMARDIAYGQNTVHRGSPRFVGVRTPTAMEISQALAKIYGNKRKNISMKAIEKVISRMYKSGG